MIAVSASGVENSIGGQVMEEAEKDSGEESRDRPLKEDEEGLSEQDQAVPDEVEGGILARVGNIARNASNLTPVSKVILILSSLYDDDIIFKEYGERREGLLAFLASIATAPARRKIIKHIFKHGAVTQPELEQLFGASWSTVSRTMKKLDKFDVTHIVGHVGLPFRAPSQPGPPIYIHVLIGADSEAAIRAQQRYANLPATQKRRRYKSAHMHTVSEIKVEIRDYLDSEGIKEANLIEIYPHFKSIFPDLSDFRKACTELGGEGYKIWQ